jgi:putative intracellular protease/amidase
MSAAPEPLLSGLNVAILAAAGSDAGHLQTVQTGLEEDGVIVAAMSLASAGLAAIDADAFDGMVLLGGADGGRALAADLRLLGFIRRLQGEGKPLGAVAAMNASFLDGNWITAADGSALEVFLSDLKQRLARRRCERFATPAEVTPSAVGEDG